MRNISQKSLLQVRLPDPAQLDQDAAVAWFSEVDLAASALASQVDVSRRRKGALRRALLAAAFAGKLTGRHSDQEIVEELASV
jgi:type I restriction enzyme S subunit